LINVFGGVVAAEAEAELRSKDSLIVGSCYSTGDHEQKCKGIV